MERGIIPEKNNVISETGNALQVQEYNMTDELKLSFEIDDVVNYAIQQNGVPVVQKVIITNTTERMF